MSGTAPTPGQLKELSLHFLKGLPANPADLAGTMWEQHLKDAAVSHEAFRALIGLTPTEALLRLNSVPAVPFPVWKTIKLGTHRSVDALQRAVSKGNRISNWAYDLMEKISVFDKLTEIGLYRATVAEIGFPDGAKFADIRAKLHELGFTDCPAEVGPQLRRQYPDQPLGEWARIMMDPITDSYGYLKVFHVGHFDNGRWLYSSYAYPEDFYDGHKVWVFARK